MAITEQITVEVASVDVNDEYRVELTQHRKVTDYSPEQAEDLAGELLHHADRAREMVLEHAAEAAARITAGSVL